MSSSINAQTKLSGAIEMGITEGQSDSKESRTQIANTEDLPQDLSKPPKLIDGPPVNVRFRFMVEYISDVDTKHATVRGKIIVALYWNDPRLIGKVNDGDLLPPKLWGPFLVLTNMIDTESVAESYEFTVQDSSTGLIKRLCRYCGKVRNPMDTRNFPFDVDDIDFAFDTYGCTYKLYDNSVTGAQAQTRTYELEPVAPPALAKKGSLFEGGLFNMRWDLELPGWECFAWGFHTKPYTTPAGAPNTSLTLMIAVSRNIHYYSFKIIVPYVFTTILTLLGHFGDPLEFYSRLSHATRMLLATSALMYISTQDLPYTNYHTYADYFALFSMGIIVADAALSAAVYLCAAHGNLISNDDAGVSDMPIGCKVFDKAGAVVLFLLYLGLLYWAVWYDKLSLQRRQHWDPSESLRKVLAPGQQHRIGQNHQLSCAWNAGPRKFALELLMPMKGSNFRWLTAETRVFFDGLQEAAGQSN